MNTTLCAKPILSLCSVLLVSSLACNTPKASEITCSDPAFLTKLQEETDRSFLQQFRISIVKFTGVSPRSDDPFIKALSDPSKISFSQTRQTDADQALGKVTCAADVVLGDPGFVRGTVTYVVQPTEHGSLHLSLSELTFREPLEDFIQRTLDERDPAVQDNAAKNTLRNGAAAEEANFVDNDEYVTCKNEECVRLLPGFSLPPEVDVEFQARSNGASFTGTASAKGSSTVHRWDSDAGGLQ